VRDLNYHLESKFGMRVNPSNYGFVGLKDFLEYLDHEGHISLEFGFVKLNDGKGTNLDEEWEKMTKAYQAKCGSQGPFSGTLPPRGVAEPRRSAALSVVIEPHRPACAASRSFEDHDFVQDDFVKKIFDWKIQPGGLDEESCYVSDQEDRPMVYGNVLGKYVLKKEVADYLPKSDYGNETITEKEVDVDYFPTHGNDLNNNALDVANADLNNNALDVVNADLNNNALDVANADLNNNALDLAATNFVDSNNNGLSLVTTNTLN